MFKFLEKTASVVAKTAIGVPVSIVADIATLGGDLTDKVGGSYTGDMMNSICQDVEEMADD